MCICSSLVCALDGFSCDSHSSLHAWPIMATISVCTPFNLHECSQSRAQHLLRGTPNTCSCFGTTGSSCHVNSQAVPVSPPCQSTPNTIIRHAHAFLRCPTDAPHAWALLQPLNRCTLRRTMLRTASTTCPLAASITLPIWGQSQNRKLQ